jgi:hypothetical protein
MSAGGGEDAGVDFWDVDSARAIEEEVIARLKGMDNHDTDEEDVLA